MTGVIRNQAAPLLDDLTGHLEQMARISLQTVLREANVTGLERARVDRYREVTWTQLDQ